MSYQTKPSETDQRLDNITLLLGELLALAAAESDHPIGAGTKQLLRRHAVRVPWSRAVEVGTADTADTARLIGAEEHGDRDARAAATRIVDARLSKAHDRLMAAAEAAGDEQIVMSGADVPVARLLRLLALKFDAAASAMADTATRAVWHDIAVALTGRDTS